MSTITVHIEADTGDGRLIQELGELFRRLHSKECDCQTAYHETTTVEMAEGLEKEQAAFIRADGLEVHPVFEGSGALGVTAFDAAVPPPPPQPASPFGAEDMGSLPPPTMQSAGLSHLNPPPPPFDYTPEGGPPTILQPPPAPAVELDSEGLPWDARIHSSSKAKLAKTGAWKLARGCPPELAVTVLAELKAAMALPRVGTPPTVTTITQDVVGGEPSAPQPPAALEQSTLPPPAIQSAPPPPPAQQPAAPPPVAAPPGTPTTFPAFLVAITQQQAAKKLTFDEVLAVLKENGLENIQLLTARPDLIPRIYSRLEALWTSR